jgi:hypothetical protein
LNTLRHRNIKKTEEIHDLDSASMKTASISAEKGGFVEEIDVQKLNRRKARLHHLKMRRIP